MLKYLGLQIGNTIWTKANLQQFLQLSRLSQILQANNLSSSRSREPIISGKNSFYFLFKAAENNSAQVDVFMPARDQERIRNLHNDFHVTKLADTPACISGYENAKAFCTWLDQWLSPETQRIYNLAEKSSACINGLLLKEYIAYLLATCKKINPNNAENFLTRYGCFGADISSALLMTNATDIDAIDNETIDVKAYLGLFSQPLAQLKKYLIDPSAFRQQREFESTDDLYQDRCNKSTWITMDHFGGGLSRGAALIYELKALGAYDLQFDEKNQELSFTWQHPFDSEARQRKLKLYQQTDIYSSLFMEMPPCDCYMQKSSMYVGFKPVTMVSLKPNASVVFGHVGILTNKQGQGDNIEYYKNQEFLREKFQSQPIPEIYSVNLHSRTADLLPQDSTYHVYGWEAQLFKKKLQPCAPEA